MRSARLIVPAGLLVLGLTLMASTASAAFIRRVAIKQSPTTYYQGIVDVADDPTDAVATVEMKIAAKEGSPKPGSPVASLRFKKIRPNGLKRYVSADFSFSDVPVGSSYVVTSTMKDAAGKAVGEPFTETVVVESDRDQRTRKFVGKTKFDRANNEMRATFRLAVAPGASAAGVTVSADFDMLDSNTVLGGSTATGTDAQVDFAAQVDPELGPYKVEVTFEGVTQSLAFAALPVEKGGAVEVTGARGVTVRLAAVDTEGTVKVTVSNENPEWESIKLGAVKFSDGFGPAALDSLGTTLAYVVSLGYAPPCDIAGERGICTWSARAADGTLLDSLLDMQVFSAEGCGLDLRKLTVDTTAGGDVKVVAYSSSAQQEGASYVAVSVTDDATGKTVLEAAPSAPTEVERQFAARGLTFEDPEAALGESYTLLLSLKTQDGGSAYAAATVVVEGPDAGFVAAVEGGGEIAGEVNIHAVPGGAFEAFVVVTSGEVLSVEVQFADFTGPPPASKLLALPMVQEWQKWVLKGQAGVGSTASGGMLSAVVTLSDAKGRIRDVRGGSVAGLPTVLFANGNPRQVCNSRPRANAVCQLWSK
ncbi:MAG: hypothetical protein R3F39_20780 [Myxococcota bacterium]